MKIFSGFCIAFLKLYQWIIAPIFISFGVRCRFEPSCSHYAIGAFQEHGPITGTFLATKRLLRCHPFCEGGLDPVPKAIQILGETRNG